MIPVRSLGHVANCTRILGHDVGKDHFVAKRLDTSLVAVRRTSA